MDCLNGEDEKNCPTVRECEPNTKCEQMCATADHSQQECSCKIGFVLHENKHK